MYNSTANSNTPVTVNGATGAVAIAGGTSHTCALLPYGTVECWGYNYYGQLGNGTTNNSSTPTGVSLPTGATARAIAAGGGHTCALLSSGTIDCWGKNATGELGNNSTTASSTPAAVNLAPGTTATAIAAGNQHSCATLSNGAVECWGDNTYGELGNATTTQSNTPVAVTAGNALPITGTDRVAAGTFHACALLSNGTVECWGDNNAGQLGNGTTNNSSTPVAVSGLSGVTAIAAGEFDTCALLSYGTVECWGDNSSGELGNGTITNSSTPAGVGGLSGAATAITAGHDQHTCALLSNGTVRCWGNNSYGQLGNGASGTGTYSTTPVAVSGLSGATAIVAGVGHTCALLSTGTVECWGFNYAGQLGNGTTTNSSTPVTVSGLSGVTAITAGDYHACALLSNGGVECWGLNGSGQLGNGTTTNSSTPVPVSGLSGATGITAGSGHSCSVLSGGTVECWGANTSGQLGNGGTTNSSTPVATSPLTPIVWASSQPTVATIDPSAGLATVPASAIGTTIISATYSNLLANTTLTVNSSGALVPVVTITLSSSSNPALVGTPVNITATVVGGVSGATVTFMDGSTSLGTLPLNASGVAGFDASALALGSHSITAVYGGDATHTGTSNTLVQQIVSTSPTPLLTALSPSTANAGASAFTMTVTGVGFMSGAAVMWNGASRTTTYVSGNQLQAAIMATDVASAGTASVLVANPAPGGNSNALTFTVLENIDDASVGGSTGYLSMFIPGSGLVDSQAYQNGSNIGIGTTAPTAPLHVVLSTAATATPAAGFVDTYSAGANGLTAVPFVTRAARGTPTNPAAVTTNDVIGGFTGRGYYAATTNPTLPAGFSGGRGSLIVRANEPWTATAQSTYIQFNTAPLGQAFQAERMRIDNAGNVGIGTTAPATPLQVVGDIRVGTSGTNGCLQNYAGTSIAGTCSSDARLKTNIVPFAPVLSKVVQLQPVHYRWRAWNIPSTTSARRSTPA